MGWLIALAVILGLGILPLGVSARYNEAGALIRLILGPVKLQVFPSNKKAVPKDKKQKPKKEQNKTSSQTKPTENTKGGKLTDFLPIVQTVLDFLGDLRRKLRVNLLELKLTLAGDDPCDLGVNYGRAWAALGNLEPQLDRLFVIKKKDLQLQCDFEGTETKIAARLDLTITLGRLLGLTARYGFRVLREYISITKSRKGGAVK